VTPLWAVLAFTFLNSIGSAVVYSGVFFLAKHAYGLGEVANFWLGVLYGATYIPAALFIGPLLRRLPTGSRVACARSLLALTMLAMAALCWVPSLAFPAQGVLADPAAATPSAWPIWLLVGVYSPLSGAMWPMVEAFLSGGRSGPQLRFATGKFNVAWSSSLVLALLAMGPLVEKHPLAVLQALSAVQLVALVALAFFPPTPAAHLHADHAPPPPVYARLLKVARVLLATAFMVMAALAPTFPRVAADLGLSPAWGPALPAAWMAARVVTFAFMERSHAWHGRWSTLAWGTGLLLAGFAGVVFTPMLAPQGSPAIAMVLAALLGFGVGVGIIYCAALYYAMEVGSAEVDAGGMHETLIGVGYTLGPACGLLAHATVARTGTTLASPTLMLIFVAVLTTVAIAVAYKSSKAT
jgi:hypothetical protein